MKQKIILIGGGGHCKSVIDVIEQDGKYNIAGIVDVNDKMGHKTLGYAVIATDYDLPELIKENYFFHITLGFIRSPQRRIDIFNILKEKNAKIPVIISPHAYVSPHAEIGQGTIIMHNAQVNAGARVGENCIINSKALIEHDTVVGDHCHISTGSILNGNIVVGAESFVGSGSITVQGARIPERSFIKAGSLYIRR